MVIAVQAPVLVLNANFEPINVCDTRRAIGLILNEKASWWLNGRGIIRCSFAYIPATIGHPPQEDGSGAAAKCKVTKREILRRDNFTCQYCGKDGTTLTIDHVMPRHMGGEHSWEKPGDRLPGLQSIHKGGRTIDQGQDAAVRIPAPPPTSADYIFARHLKENQEWVPFIDGW